MYQFPELEESEKQKNRCYLCLSVPMVDQSIITLFHLIGPWTKCYLEEFLTAFNSFSDELFAESLDRANFGQYNILMKTFENIKLVYVFKGPSYKVSKNL